MSKIDNDLSNEIVASNIKNLLDKTNLKQKEFAEQIYESNSTISKWCNGKQLPTGEQMIKIIEFFKIEPNELFYSSTKLEKINYQKSNKVIKPVLAQKNIEINCIKERMCKIHYFIIESIIILYFVWFAMLVVNTGAIQSENYYVTILSLVIVTVGGAYLVHRYGKKQFVKKTYIIGHTEDIFYEIEDTNNKYFRFIGLIKITSIILYLITIYVVITRYIGVDDISKIINIFIVLVISLFLMVPIINLVCNKKDFQKRKKSQDFIEYKRNIADVFLPLFSLIIVTAFNHLYSSLILLIILDLIIFVLGVISLVLITKEMYKYKLSYENYNDVVVALED